MKLLCPLILIVACAATPPDRAFDEAEQKAHGTDQERVRDLYRVAATGDPDPQRRDKAAVQAANREWRVFHNAAAARELLARVSNADASTERARMERLLTRDYAAARGAVLRALSLAKTSAEKREAVLESANATLAEAIAARRAGRCPDDGAALRAAAAEIDDPTVHASQVLLRMALLSRDDDTALRAWRRYYADVPSLVPSAVADRGSLGIDLADTRLFAEAALVLRDPCDARVENATAKDILAYADALERIQAIADEHYRACATGDESGRKFEKAIRRERKALPKDFEQRFGAVVTVGETDNVPSMHYGHRILDERRAVEQYGHRGTLRFVLLDGMVSNGYMSWIFEGRSGAGGWNDGDVVYQIRPMYADGPVRAWQGMTDSELRAKRDQEIADETRRDAEHAKTQPLRAFRGLILRMERQYTDALRASLVAQGLEGDALRDAFIERFRREQFDSSIWAHEGRHSIDRKLGIDDPEELEFRAKLSEVAFAASAREGLSSLLRPIGDGSPHGEANKRILAELMRRAKLSSLTELDQLTDAQLREAVRSMDPLARR